MGRPGKTYAKLNRDGEVLAAGLFDDLVAAVDAGEVDEGWLDDAALALDGLNEFLREAVNGC